MSDTDILPAPDINPYGTVHLSKWDREKRAFRMLYPSLLPKYNGQYVAIHEEQVVGWGPDQFEVARDAYGRFGYVPIYVGLITDKPRPPARVPYFRVVR